MPKTAVCAWEGTGEQKRGMLGLKEYIRREKERGSWEEGVLGRRMPEEGSGVKKGEAGLKAEPRGRDGETPQVWPPGGRRAGQERAPMAILTLHSCPQIHGT